MGVPFGVQHPYTVRPQSDSYETLYFRPRIAVIMGDRWALSGPSGTRSLILLAYLESPGQQAQHVQTAMCDSKCSEWEVWPKLVLEKQCKWGL